MAEHNCVRTVRAEYDRVGGEPGLLCPSPLFPFPFSRFLFPLALGFCDPSARRLSPDILGANPALTDW